MPAASPASPVISAAAISSRSSESPPLPLRRRGRRAGQRRPRRADRLADRRHLLHQIGEPPVLGDFPLGLLQFRPGFQVHVDGLAADAPRQVVLRPVTAVPGLRAGAVRLAALAPHHVQRAPPEVPDLGDKGEQLAAPALQPRQVTPGEVSHVRPPRPQRADPLVASLAEDAYLDRRVEAEVLDVQDYFGGPCAGVVEEGEQGPVAQPETMPSRRHGQQGLDLVLVEVGHRVRGGLLERDAGDPAA